jgi:hypothetical protein
VTLTVPHIRTNAKISGGMRLGPRPEFRMRPLHLDVMRALAYCCRGPTQAGLAIKIYGTQRTPMTSRDIGNMGERHFSAWCSACGLSANRSEEDKTGWDFVLETPGVEHIGEDGPIDEPPFECKVQIKATDKQERHEDIILDKLWRLAVDPYPAFIIFIEYDGLSDAQRVYVKHVDQELIRRVLKKIHKIEQSDKDNRYNHRTIRVGYSDLDLLPKPHGESLRNALLHHVPDGLTSYVMEKAKFKKIVGREEGGFSLHVTVEGQENIERMIEQSVGITTSFEVTKVIGEQVRFGIKKKRPDIDAEGGLLSIQSDHKIQATLALRVDKYSPFFCFPVACKPSPFNSVTPPKMHLIRIYNSFIDLRMYPGANLAKVFITYDGQQESELSILKDQLSVISHLAKGKTLLAELRLEDGSKIEFDFGADPSSDIDSAAIDQQLDLVCMALETVRKSEWSSSVKASLPDLISQSESILTLHDLFSGRDFLMIGEFNVATVISPGQEVTAIYMLSPRIGSLQLHALLTFSGACQKVSMQKYRIEAAPVIERLLIHEASSPIGQADIVDIVNTLVASRPDATYIGLNVGDGE